ncbi:hypothetical protein ACFL2F_02910, partial [Myxococcota bacterium]
MNRVILTVLFASLFFWGCSDSGTSKLCGNSKIDDGETCDPPATCPVDCDDSDPCTADTLIGSDVDCDADCVNTPIT